MGDIKIPDPKPESARGTEPGAILKHIEAAQKMDMHDDRAVGGTSVSSIEPRREPSTHVKVLFSKFVQLIATHDFEEVMKRHANEDVVVSASLLTDLANAHQEETRSPTKVPAILLLGIVIGMLITYFVFRS